MAIKVEFRVIISNTDNQEGIASRFGFSLPSEKYLTVKTLLGYNLISLLETALQKAIDTYLGKELPDDAKHHTV
jgi:hypothetical protein